LVYEIVNALLENDAIDLEAADHTNRRTPLIWASSHRHTNIVDALLDARANMHTTDAKGRMALDVAVGETRKVLERRQDLLGSLPDAVILRILQQ
jgi:ankyrin repeat protein